MRKNQTLFIMVICGLLVLPLSVLSGSTLLWAEEEKLVPMELDGTEWEVTMVSVSKKGKKSNSEDKLIFADKKFISEKFEKSGYEPTNYSLTLEEDGTTKFGTMQIKGKDILFWKGLIEDNTIDGSVHTQFSGGKSTRTTYFNGTLTSGVLFRQGEKPPPPPVVEPIPVEEVAVEQAETVESAAAEAKKPVVAIPTESE